MLYDAFICHASEDKDGFVRPLAERLVRDHVEVWYDEFSLTVGDSLRQAMSLMTERRVRHVLATKNGRVAGIVSTGDVVKHRLEELELETNVLRDGYIAARAYGT